MGEGKEEDLSPFPLILASFFALSPCFAQPKLVCSPILVDFWVFLSLKTHRNACYAGYLSPTLIFLYVIIYILVHLFNIIERLLPDAHCYADSSQLYLSFRPADGLSSQNDAIQAMERYIEDIRHWIVSERLLLNDEKTEFLLIGTHQQLTKVDLLPLRGGTMDIEPVNCTRNLGAWFDSMLSMETHINKVCSSGFYYLHNLKRIRRYLSQDWLVPLIHAFVISQVDLCTAIVCVWPPAVSNFKITESTERCCSYCPWP